MNKRVFRRTAARIARQNVDLLAQATNPSISINNIYLAEGNSGNKTANFTVKLSRASTQTITVNFNIDPAYSSAGVYPGIATASSDYVARSGRLTFNPGETQKTIGITVLGDTAIEPTEAFRVQLTSATNAAIENFSGNDPIRIVRGVATIVDDDGSSPPANFRYGEALQKSLLFYEAQRSGRLPTTNRIAWRGNSALTDGSDVGRNLSGGYYDAGDHTKIGITMASTLATLAWGLVEYRDAYAAGGQLDEALSALKWGTDYLLKCHVTGRNAVTGRQETKAFYGLVGVGSTPDGRGEHDTWMKPEQIDSAKQQGILYRPAFKIDAAKPGSDLAAEAAATLAAASIVFRPTDYAYAERLLTAAKRLFTFADINRGMHTDSIPEVASLYPPRNPYLYWDELAWGAAWLFQATGTRSYLNKAEQIYSERIGGSGDWTQNYEDKSYGLGIILAAKTGKAQYRATVENWLNGWMNQTNGYPTYTPGGLAVRSDYGPLGLSSMTAFLAMMYADTVLGSNAAYFNFAKQQIDYALGKNPLKISYMVGFGDQSPLRVHHRGAQGGNASTIYSLQPNPNVLYGALLGGPASADDGDFTDNRRAYQPNEPTFSYSAGLTGALARLYYEYGGEPLSDAALAGLPGLRSGSSQQRTLCQRNDRTSQRSIQRDRLTGSTAGSLHVGADKVDILTGHSGADVFVLGNFARSRYSQSGTNDYALIKNFSLAQQDVIQLHGSKADYALAPFAGGSGIFRHVDRGSDLIAVVQKAQLSQLSDSVFSFV